ncbi:MAG: acyl-CoA dehydrogenase C-terminal domain-containing protein, partial [Marinobacter sp.]|uniref:acyl-CoA dehydrogenase C-terminal domain-containing protein n=1 Tax=Marinobacter sp. TaxID=50741 RepID=UPI00299DB9FF
LESLVEATEAINRIRRAGETERALANASLYLEAFGHLVVGWLWLRQALVAQAGLNGHGPRTPAFYDGKLKACDYFCRYELPRVNALAGLLRTADTTTLEISEESF